MDFFKSELRKKLLLFYFTNIDKKMYVRELARILDEDPSNLARELKRLSKSKIFLSEERGKEKFYFLNKKYILFEELKGIVAKTVGLQKTLEKNLLQIKGIKKAFIFGSFAKGTEYAGSDIDLLIIGTINKDKLNEKLRLLEDILQREINYHSYTLIEFNKKKNKDDFLKNIVNGPKIELIGKNEN